MIASTIDCEYLIDGGCAIIREHSGATMKPHPDACKACCQCDKPKQLNMVTASLAMSAIGLPLPQEKKYLTEYVRQYEEGAGTELKKLISWIWSPARKCQRCADRVRKMNKWGPAKCRARRSLIVEWLRQSAHQHGLPFSEIAAGAMIDLAISTAEKKQKAKPQCKPRQPVVISRIEPIKPKPKYSAVWVYWKGGAAEDELEYSIRSAITNLSDLANVVVCGDHPGDWYDGDFIHSPRFNKQDGIAKFGSGRFSKWIDSAVKLQKIIDSDMVSESFLWMYDDTFFVRPWSIEETAILRAGGSLWHMSSIDQPVRSTWREVMRRTAKALVDRGLPQRNYSTHYPVVYQKSLLQRTINEFELLECARLVESIYLNHHFRNPSPVKNVFQYSKKIGKDWIIYDRVSVVNVGGFHARAQEIIKPMFPNHLPIPRLSKPGLVLQ